MRSVAAKIGSGRYLAVRRDNEDLRFVSADGRTVDVKIKSVDRRSGLMLLAGEDLPGPAFRAPSTVGGKIVALLGSGARLAESSGRSVVGIRRADNVALPLVEVQQEKGLGIPDRAVFVSGRELRGAVVSVAPTATVENAVGPTPLSVTYMLSPTAMRRVISGFLTESGKVAYPFVGLSCRDAAGGGAEISAIEPRSPAERAGLRVGDVLLTLDATEIRRQTDFARAMFRLEPGRVVFLRYRRGTITATGQLTVGKSTD